MGGGVGISVHGSFRVVTEDALFAMPEAGKSVCVNTFSHQSDPCEGPVFMLMLSKTSHLAVLRRPWVRWCSLPEQK